MIRKTSILAGLLAGLLASLALASTASAAPAWRFEGKELTGSETILGGAYESALTVPGLTTTCEDFLYKLTIKNEGGTGKGELTEMPLFECTTDSDACAVKTIAAETLPYPAHLTEVKSQRYIVIEKAKVSITYSGIECALSGIKVKVTGSAGGLINNEAETATFSAESFAATGTQLFALETPIEWTGVFPTEAFETHRLQAISAS